MVKLEEIMLDKIRFKDTIDMELPCGHMCEIKCSELMAAQYAMTPLKCPICVRMHDRIYEMWVG